MPCGSLLDVRAFCRVFLDEESRRGTDPLHVLIVVHSHHLPASHANDRHDGNGFLLPNVHDANLSLGSSKWSINHWFELHALLEYIITTMFFWDRLQLGNCRMQKNP